MVPGFGVWAECQSIGTSGKKYRACYLAPLEEDTSKIWDTTGTVFIQAPSILLLVWRSIMFNGSFLRVCRILRFVKKNLILPS